jgi:hypothetical protein
MADGNGGLVNQDSNNYDEPPRSTGNRMFTDYQEDQKVKQNSKYASFKDRRVK